MSDYKPIKPVYVNILGTEHIISYGDMTGLDAWGHYNEHKRELAIHDSPDDFERWQITIHELLHAIEIKLKLTKFKGKKGHAELDLIALGIADFFVRNELLKTSLNAEDEKLSIKQMLENIK